MAFLPKKKVLVPVDFSDPSAHALDVAKELVESPDCVYVVHVLPPSSPVEPGVLFGNVTKESRLEKATAAVTKKMTEAGHEGVRVQVRVGSPPKEIVAYAQQIDADLIVMPSRGHNVLEAFHMGSTASRVIQLAKRPVLVLKD